MNMNKPTLPKFMVYATILIALLAGIASLLGLFMAWPYANETLNWRQQAQGQDVGNLIAIVTLLAGLFAARKGSSRGLFVWFGSLLYFLYAYVVYAMAVHFSSLFLVYVAVLGLTFYTLIFALRVLPVPQLKAKSPRTFAGSVLLGVGVLFTLLWLSEIIPALFIGEAPKSLAEAGLIVNPIHVIDLSVVLPAFIMTAYFAIKNKRLGLTYVAPWLVFSALMGASIVATMIIYALSGNTSVAGPATMVSLVVILSFVGAFRYLKAIK